MRQLVVTWVAAERAAGYSTADAIRMVNETCGTKLTHSRVSEWKKGVYVPAPQTLSMLLWRALPYALKQAGIEITDKQFADLCRAIWWDVEEGADGITVALL